MFDKVRILKMPHGLECVASLRIPENLHSPAFRTKDIFKLANIPSGSVMNKFLIKLGCYL